MTVPRHWADGLTLAAARSRQLRDGVRVVCPCETGVEDPGPHVDECPFVDPNWEPAPDPPAPLYLGDGVYTRAHADGMVELFTHDGFGVAMRIWLEPDVLRALVAFATSKGLLPSGGGK